MAGRNIDESVKQSGLRPITIVTIAQNRTDMVAEWEIDARLGYES
jgi:hypothetical protein